MSSYRFEKPKKKKEISSGWRGIGCVLMVVLPVISYYGAFLALEITEIRTIFARAMAKLFIRIPLPAALYKITFMAKIWQWIETQNTLLVAFILGTLILIALSAFISVFYSIMYRTVVPKKYGPTDAPPQKHKTKRYSR